MNFTQVCVNRALLTILAACFAAGANAQVGPADCGPLRSVGQYGPWDYRTDKKMLVIVEKAHFQPSVEALMRSPITGPPGGDLDYTLRASPNHHRALLAILRYGDKLKTEKTPGATYVLECYFERAIRFANDDPIARMIYAMYLSKRQRSTEALHQLREATVTARDNPFTNYNIGLVYFDMQEYDKALAQAHKATELGLDQPALREQLKAAGKWREPTEQGQTSNRKTGD
jgi:tetratricopeptide (TPR) repeat protein